MNGTLTDSRRNDHRQRGFALVMVLWLVVLLGVIAGGHIYNASTETRLAAMHLHATEARAAVEAGLSVAILDLLDADPADKRPNDGTVTLFRFAQSDVRIAVRDATGLIDLNAANPDLLLMLATALEVDNDDAKRLVAAILDWRDGDDLKHVDGAEAAEYLADGYAWTPGNRPFSSVDELRYVRGMSQRLFEEMTPFVTVYSQRAGLNLEFAPPFLLNAMTGRGEIPAADTSGHRTSAGVYHVYVSASTAQGSGASAEVVIQVGAEQDVPYRILSWRDSMRTPFPPDLETEG